MADTEAASRWSVGSGDKRTQAHLCQARPTQNGRKTGSEDAQPVSLRWCHADNISGGITTFDLPQSRGKERCMKHLTSLGSDDRGNLAQPAEVHHIYSPWIDSNGYGVVAPDVEMELADASSALS